MNFDKEKLIKALSSAVAETFEGMAFSELEETEVLNEIPLTDKEYSFSRLAALEPFEGQIGLFVPNAYLQEILETTIDPETEVDMEKMRDDLVAEILNTIAGSFMSKLLPDSQEFKIGLPSKTHDYPENKVKMKENDLGLKLMIEFHEVYCYLEFIN